MRQRIRRRLDDVSTTIHLAQEISKKESISNDNKIRERSLDKTPSVHCRVIMVDTMYVVDDVDDLNNSTIDSPSDRLLRKRRPNITTVERASCIPIVDGMETDEVYTLPDLSEGLSQEPSIVERIRLGKYLLSIRNASVAVNGAGLQTSEHSIYEPLHDPDRQLQLDNAPLEWKASMSVAIIRVSTIDAAPSDSTQYLQSLYFNPTGVNFVTQYDACSFGRFKLKAADGVGYGGILDVQVNQPIANFADSYDALINEAQNTIKAANPSLNSISDLADRIIFCLPTGTGSWAASAGVRHWRVQMNDQWCHSLTGMMHELGHTFGLLHSHADGIEYNDRTGYMGSGGTDAYTPRKCFNGYQAYLFGWYMTRHIHLDPTVNGNQLIQLATFVDYDKADPNQHVIMIIDNTYYFLYNRAKGFNVDTEQKRDEVTISQPVEDGTDSLLALMPGGSIFTRQNYKGSGLTLIVEACQIVAASTPDTPDVMMMSVGLDVSLCNLLAPTQAPTRSPTVAPTLAPTLAPISPPTIAPTSAPISLPTNRPTLQPATSAPTYEPTMNPVFLRKTRAPATYQPSSIPIQTRSPATYMPSLQSVRKNAPTNGTSVEDDDNPFFHLDHDDGTTNTPSDASSDAPTMLVSDENSDSGTIHIGDDTVDDATAAIFNAKPSSSRVSIDVNATNTTTANETEIDWFLTYLEARKNDDESNSTTSQEMEQKKTLVDFVHEQRAHKGP